ncbi:metal-dependent hydrolase [Pelotomaculum schinkii]|uniref:metal-dependent hydrolase n=1 Tax=Pelotomaculum schinkii TaxID=78350 RepID=UPI003CFF8428
MLFPTHFVGGALTALIFSTNGDAKTTVIAAVTGGIAALLPDIDSPKSFLGSRVPLAPSAIRMTLGHRGPLHSLAAAGAVYVLFQWYLPQVLTGLSLGLNYWIFWGYASHLLLDMLTPEGVPLLWPVQGRLAVPIASTGSILERFMVFPAVSSLFLFILYKKIGGVFF